MLSLYYTLVYPYLNYCNIAWSSTYPSYLNILYLLQKRIVRIITTTDYRAHTAPLFRKLKIFDVFSVNSFLIASFMYSYHNQLLPDTFHSFFSTNRDTHNYNTRHPIDYRSHHCRTNIKQFTKNMEFPTSQIVNLTQYFCVQEIPKTIPYWKTIAKSGNYSFFVVLWKS